MDIIESPFSKDQVDRLNNYQIQGMFHPFTCPDDGDDKHIKYEFNRKHSGENYEEYIENEHKKGIPYPEMEFTATNLVATENGWICPVCGYTQNWAHLFMMQK